jgi:two-component system, OmpR family, sensor kinase
MNKITKKSFYSFLALYLISTFTFLFLSAYWFFTSQVSMEKNANYYKMNHIADTESSKVIDAQMHNKGFELGSYNKADVALLDKDKKLLYGGVYQKIDFTQEFYLHNGAFTLVTQKPAGQFGIKYVVVQSSECTSNIAVIKNKLLYTVTITAFIILIIAVVLSYIFLKPLRDKMHEIEEFVKDTTHELNTPITALMMSSSRMKSKQLYDEKIVQNISISAKQLYDIYASLSFLSFDNSKEEAINLEFNSVTQESISYFKELFEKKRITLSQDIKPCELKIAPTKAKMLVNNLLSNAIKYSKPKTHIKVYLTQEKLIIEDEGIGIAQDKLKLIFKRFERASTYAGGFGVGLSIVDNIVKEYGYKIDVESQEGKGTKITLTFR